MHELCLYSFFFFFYSVIIRVSAGLPDEVTVIVENIIMINTNINIYIWK